MPVTTQHKNYSDNNKIGSLIEIMIDGQDAVKAAKEKFLPKTSGMENSGDADYYDAYIQRARFYELTKTALIALQGIAFSETPQGNTESIVTPSSDNVLDVIKECLQEIAVKGRACLLIDAPIEGGAPYLILKDSADVINWRYDDNGKIQLVVIKEYIESQDNDRFNHDVEVFYRVIEAEGKRYYSSLYNEDSELVQEPIQIRVNGFPVVFIGATDLQPEIKDIPLAAIANCDKKIYELTADLYQSLYLTAQPNFWVAVDSEAYSGIIKAGFGSASLWNLGEDAASNSIGVLEYSGDGIPSIERAIEREKSYAESLGVKLVRSNDKAESAEALRIRTASKQASLSTMISSLNEGINKALAIAGIVGEEVKINLSLSKEQAEAQMINAINAAVNSDNLPRSTLIEYIKNTGVSEKSEDEILRDLEIAG